MFEPKDIEVGDLIIRKPTQKNYFYTRGYVIRLVLKKLPNYYFIIKTMNILKNKDGSDFKKTSIVKDWALGMWDMDGWETTQQKIKK